MRLVPRTAGAGWAWLLVLTASGVDVVRTEPFDAVELTLTGHWIRPA